jgi:predicted protein tyrosine phosphatase
MFIQNVSMADVVKGKHDHVPGNTALIQIQDYGCFQFAKPAKKFISVNQFKFDDHDDPSRLTNITDEQAQNIADILKNCHEFRINVIVHCHAGICRSGAVAEAGIVMGFENRSVHRIPNVLVKGKLFKELGFTNSWD